MSSFKDFYYNPEEAKKPQKITEEDLFLEATDVQIPSLRAFTAWLVLNQHVRSTVKLRENKKKVSVFSLNPTQRVLYLVKNVPHLKELAKEFSFKWGE